MTMVPAPFTCQLPSLGVKRPELGWLNTVHEVRSAETGAAPTGTTSVKDKTMQTASDPNLRANVSVPLPSPARSPEDRQGIAVFPRRNRAYRPM